MIAPAMSATRIPAAMSSQKWLAVAMTENETQAGHASQNALTNLLLAISAMLTPTMNASAAWRLGIAAYGFDASSIEARAVIQRAELEQRVLEPERLEHPRRRGRREDVADQTDGVSEQDPVPEAVEVLRSGEDRPRAGSVRRP